MMWFDLRKPHRASFLIAAALVFCSPLGASFQVSTSHVIAGNAPPLAVLSTVSVAGAPNPLGVDPQSGNLFVPLVTGGLPDSSLVVLSSANNAVLASIPMRAYPQEPIFDPAGGTFYLPNGPSTVSVISTSTDSVTSTIGGLGGGIPTYDPAGNSMIIPNLGGSNATVINATTNAKTGSIAIGSFQPLAMTYDPANGNLYAVGGGWTQQVNVSVVSGLSGLLLTKYPIWNSSQGTSFLSEMTAPKVLEYDPVNHDLYFSNFANDTVAVISSSTNRPIAMITVGHQPGVPTCDPATGDVFVPNQRSDNVSVISGSTNRVVATIAGIPSPWEIGYDPALGDLLVPSDNETSNPLLGHQITFVSGADYRVLGALQVGVGPQTPTFDPANGKVYVTNFWSNNISVLGAPSSAPSILGIPPWEFYALVGSLSTALVLAVVVVVVRRKRKRAKEVSVAKIAKEV